MERYYEAEFTQLRDRILQMSYLALENYDRAVNGFFAREESELRRTIQQDEQIDQMELMIDAECIELLLRLQPFAKDLRFAAMAMKINTNLERMGDQAVFMARAGLDLMRLPVITDFFQLPRLASMARNAVEQAMLAFAREDSRLAREIRQGEKQINAFYRQIIKSLLEFAMETPSQLPQSVELLFIAQSLERVADYAKNIADEVIYLVEAEDVRHRQ